MNVRDHILRKTSALLSQSFSAGDADGDVTIEILRANGDVLVAETPSVHNGTGVYQHTLDGVDEVERLTIIWSGLWGGDQQVIQTEADVVGAHLFTVAQARAYDKGALSNPTTYPDSAIREERDAIADFFEEVCGQSFIQRYGVEVLDGGGYADALRLSRHPNKILRATADGSVVTVSGISVSSTRRLVRDAGWPSGYSNIVVEYEYGMTAVPARIHQAALMLARYDLVARDISDRTISISNELGAVRLAVPTFDYPTGLPFVDAVLSQYERKVLIGS